MASQEQPAAPAGQPQVVIRREIRQMDRSEQERFCAAVETMMAGGPDSSEYFRLAGYHGWPGNFCAHGVELFPTWHRGYMVDFEAALQAADKKNGKDGNIGLPYWDWTNTDHPEMFPAIIRERFEKLKPDLFTDSNDLKVRGYRINTDDYIRRMIRANGLANQTFDAILEPQFWQFASTEFQGSSVEVPHNSIHVFCGFPMSVVSWAAFHPIFFLHHANIDRLFEAHLAYNREAQAEMEAHEWSLLLEPILSQNEQRRRRRLPLLAVPEKSDPNRPLSSFERPIAPFRHPFTGRDLMPSDCFSSRDLGYQYDLLPAPPSSQLIREPPVFAVFKNVDVTSPALSERALTLLVFLVPLGQEAAWQLPSVGPEGQGIDAAMQGCAGVTAVFGGKGGKCENCTLSRRPISIRVDVSEGLRALGLGRHQAAVKVAVLDEDLKVRSLESLPALPTPTLEGPFFEALGSVGRLGEQGLTNQMSETLQLQKYLSKFGYLKRPLGRGIFDGPTHDAVQQLQKLLHVTVDGVFGPETRAAMMRPRHDDGVDLVDKLKPAYKWGQQVNWWVGFIPGYLNEDKVKIEVLLALSQWQGAAPLTFQEVQCPNNADLCITWADHSPDNLFQFEGQAGGALAHTQAGRFITLDVNELWLQQGEQPRPHPAGGQVYPSFYLLPVILHEIGHVIGLSHSENPSDVMYPYYNVDRLHLSSGDKQRVAELFAAEDECCSIC